MRLIRGRNICPQPGGGDLNPLSTPFHLKPHISNEFMTLSLDASLLRIPPVALLKLVTLRFSTTGLLFIEHFGHLVCKDPVIVPFGKAKQSDTLGAITVMYATKDLWATNKYLTALINTVNGL